MSRLTLLAGLESGPTGQAQSLKPGLGRVRVSSRVGVKVVMVTDTVRVSYGWFWYETGRIWGRERARL